MTGNGNNQVTSYITVCSEASDEIVIQKSRFIGYAAPCETEDEALEYARSRGIKQLAVVGSEIRTKDTEV